MNKYTATQRWLIKGKELTLTNRFATQREAWSWATNYIPNARFYGERKMLGRSVTKDGGI